MSADRKRRPVVTLLLLTLVAVIALVGALFFLIGERTQVSAAALADSSCYASLTEAERGLFLPLYVGGRFWRVKETRLRRQWMIDQLSVLQIATVAYGEVTPPCRKSILGLLDAYLANGADINMISDTRRRWTVLQGAIVMADAGLTCALLRRGASPDARFSKPGSPIDGLTVLQFVKRGIDIQPENRDRRRTLDAIEQYQASGRCID
jgi:hypothetical protein